MEHSKTIGELISRLTKDGYRIRIEDFLDDHACIIEVYKNESRWSKIVSYDLISCDDYFASILESLEKRIEELEKQ